MTRAGGDTVELLTEREKVGRRRCATVGQRTNSKTVAPVQSPEVYKAAEGCPQPGRSRRWLPLRNTAGNMRAGGNQVRFDTTIVTGPLTGKPDHIIRAQGIGISGVTTIRAGRIVAAMGRI